MVGLISSLERKFKLFFQESELANFHSFTCRFCKELTKIQKKKKDPDGRQKSLHLVSIGRIEQAGFS